jgi:long-chain acyl-CoA synthetase
MKYPTFPETSMAAIAFNRSATYENKKHLTAHYRDGVHVDSWNSWTFRQETEEGLRLAAAWRALGIEPREKVAIVGKNRPRWAFTFTSLLGSNIVTVPVYPTLTAAEMAFVLRDSGARFAVADTLEQAQKIASVAAECPDLKKVYVMDRIEAGGHKKIAPYEELVGLCGDDLHLDETFKRVREIRLDDLIALIYTSGTTGRPKGVMLTNANFLSQRVVLPLFNICADDVLLNHLPFCHAFGMTADLAASVDVGAELVIADGIAPEQIRHALTTIRPTVLMSVPRLFEKLFVEVRRVVSLRPEAVRKIFKNALDVGKQVFDLRNSGKPLPLKTAVRYALAKRVLMKVRAQAGLDRLRIAYAGGGPTSRELCYFFQSLGIDIYQGYGLTETSPIANVNVPGKNKLGTVGPPIRDVEEKIAEDGEILIRGPNLMKGYYNNQAATAEAIDAEGWLHSGDIGFLDEDGYLTITDRKKEIIVTAGGKNVAPLAIESAFNTEPYIERVVAIGDRRRYLTALVCPNFEMLRDWAKQRGIAAPTKTELAAHPEVAKLMEERVAAVNQQFARYEQIKRIAVMDHEFTEETGELTPTQKVKRRVVDAMYKDVIDRMYPDDGLD